MTGRGRESGLTLIEVVAALGVVAIACLALVRVGAETLRGAARAEHHALASLVADNRLVEDVLARAVPGAGIHEGEVVIGGRRWRWSREVGEDLDGALVRIEIEVRGPDDADDVSVWRVGWRER